MIDRVTYTIKRDPIRGWQVTTDDDQRGIFTTSFTDFEPAMDALMRRVEHDAWELRNEVVRDP